MVVEKKAFGVTLSLVITCTQTDGVSLFGTLRVEDALRGHRKLPRSTLGYTGSHPLCQPEAVDRSHRGSFGRLDRIVLVMDRDAGHAKL